MAILGQSTDTSLTFTIAGSFGDVAGGSYTVPSPGIIVNDINCYYNDNGGGGNTRFYLWADSAGIPGGWLIRSGLFTSFVTMGWHQRTDLTANTGVASDLYLPAGTKIWIGYYVSTGISALHAQSAGATRLGNTSDGTWSDHAQASTIGEMASYIDYTVLAAPTLSGASPNVAPVGQTTVLTGTNLLHTTGVTVCGVNAPTFTITSNTSITVTVPSGASGAGTIVVTTPAGTASTAFTAGQVYYGLSGSAVPIKAVWYGDTSGSGVPHKAVGIWGAVAGSPKREF